MHELTPDLILQGEYAALEPLRSSHAEQLGDAAADGELWNLHFTSVPNRDHVNTYIAESLQNLTQGIQHPFVVKRLSDNRIVGCTRYYDIDRKHRTLSIGYTWYSKSVQRTAINTECKLMLLTHAFEELNCISVAFHTDDQNTVSQAAITRLGAKKEGVLRNNKIMPDGRIRHTWCFSITNTEWPEVKQNLVNRLAIA